MLDSGKDSIFHKAWLTAMCLNNSGHLGFHVFESFKTAAVLSKVAELCAGTHVFIEFSYFFLHADYFETSFLDYSMKC